MRLGSQSIALQGSAAAVAPWSFFERHRHEPWPFFLDRTGSVTYAGSRPCTQLVVDADGAVRRWENGRWRRLDVHPIDAISDFVDANAAPPRVPVPHVLAGEALPRTVGYLAYELGAFIEDVPVAGCDPAGLPLAVLSTYDRVDAWCPETGYWMVDFACDSGAARLPPADAFGRST